MSRIRKQIREVMNEMNARATRVRPGSVLILVVVLLVLMALLGTAYLVTARNDRAGARLYSHNVQIDMLVQGVENMAIAALSDTTYQKSDLQHYDDWYTTSTTPITGATPVDHSWFCSRYPVTLLEGLGSLSGTPKYPVPKGTIINGSAGLFESLVDNNTTAPAPGANWAAVSGYTSTTMPMWPAISAPLAARTYFEDPRYPAVNVRPDYVRTMVSPFSVSVGGKNYPAFRYWSTINSTYETAMAASASGNGIADSFLWRLPIGTIDGITYYAAVRIIDNNSAINVNTANSSSYDYNFDGTANTIPAFSPGIFPSNIGLAELTRTYLSTSNNNDATISPEVLALNKIRFNFATTSSAHPAGIVNSGSSPITDTGAPRTDFNYLTVGDALYHGLGRRVNNPGYVAAGAQFQALTIGDAAALAYKFDLPNPFASPTLTEQSLVNSVWNSTGTPGPASAALKTNFQSTPWDPSQFTAWFQQYFEGSASLNRRAFITTKSGLSNLMPVHTPFTTTNTGLTAAGISTAMSYMIAPGSNYATSAVPRCSLNTADVSTLDAIGTSKGPTLWFTFYNAMLDAIPPSPTANAAILTTPQGFGPFRSPIRDMNGFGVGNAYTSSTTYLSGPETLLLRSLLAAVNAKDLRDSGDNAEVAVIPQFPAQKLGGTANVYAYGTERQVFITETYVNTEVNAPKTLGATGKPDPYAGQSNPKGYFAVELYNPYDYPVDLSWWTLVVVSRSTTVVTAKPLTNFNGFANGDTQNAMMPGHSYMILQNLPPAGIPGASANDATYVPSGVSTNGAKIYYVPNLHEVLNGQGGELVLLRQPNAHGSDPANNTDPRTLQTNAAMAVLSKFAPVDSFDFSGMQATDGGAPGSTLHDYHYVRANPGVNGPQNATTTWKFVYPGRWDPKSYAPYRQEGIQTTQWIAPDPAVDDPIPAGKFDPWFDAPPTPGINLGLGTGDPQPSYNNPFPAVQLNNTDMGGPNKLLTTQQPYLFPFGGFARLGDVLQVPFVGSYMIFNSAGILIEMNPVTRDVAAADDNDGGTDDSVEQLGRFCPLLATQEQGNSVPPAAPVENFVPIGNYDPYGWANHVLDYFSAIQNPNDDYFPNVDPNVYTLGPWNMNNLVYTGTPVGVALPVANTLNSGIGPNKGTEDTIANEGLININTANWRTLAAIPWIPTTTPAANTSNIAIAKAIVTFRNTYGPFKTLFDLNKVPNLQTFYGDPKSTSYPPAAGNISPLWTGALPTNAQQSDNVTNDFEGRFGMITRVSNLVTTRSDTFTVYVLVQGWTGVGTANPSLVVQRRAAFIADRTQLTKSNPTLSITPVQAY